MPFRRRDWWIGGAYSAALEQFVFLRVDGERVQVQPRPECASKFDSQSAALARLDVARLAPSLGLDRLVLMTLPGIAYDLCARSSDANRQRD
jgi:hypothetical protein